MADAFRAGVQAAVDAAATAATLTDRDAAALAASFYKDLSTGGTVVSFGPGWDELTRFNSLGGYDGLALLHGVSRTLAVVNRGTEGARSFADWRQNVGAALFDEPGRQLTSALDILVDACVLATPARFDRVLFCGHSLGGSLADAQAALASAVFARRGLPDRPVRAVGVASAGMARAARRFAADRNLAVAADPQAFVTHYIRAEDRVPHHPGREVFGRDRLLGSIFQCRHHPPAGARGGAWEWRVGTDELVQHGAAGYHALFDCPADRHVWYSHGEDRFEVRPGARPAWGRRAQRPVDW